MLATASRDNRLEYLALLTEKSRRQCERSLKTFIEQAWSSIEPTQPLAWNWHLDNLCALLEAVSRGEVRHALINIPPGCMKSLLVSVLWPAWEWTTRPELRYLCVSYEQSLSTRDNKRVRDLVTSEWYQARWPTVQLEEDQNQKTRFNTTSGGWRIATTVNGKGMGEHPHRKIVDDPHNVKEAESDTERQAAIDFYDHTLPTRGAALNAATIVIMQRLHEKDLSGHILEKADAGLVHLCYPMRYEPGRMPDADPRWADRRSTPGELLWEQLWPEGTLRPIEMRLGSYGTAGQLQQRPAPAEGGILKTVWWNYLQVPPMPRLDELVLSFDTALKDKTKSDYWAGEAWGRRGADAFLLRIVRGRWGLVEGTQQVRDLYHWAREAFPGVRLSVLIENTAAGPDVIAALRRKVPGIIAVTPKGEKVQRVFAISPFLEAGNVWVVGAPLPDRKPDRARTPAWTLDFLAECAAFPNGAYDDQVDAMSQALLRFFGSGGSVATIKAGEKPAKPTNGNGHAPPVRFTADELRRLEQDVAVYGSAAVLAVRRLADRTFTLPDHLQGVAARNGH